jgi:hypothetical protein
MRDFNKHSEEFGREFAEFDRDFARIRKWRVFISILSIIISLGGIGFLVWVVVALMRFFSVI